MLVWEVWALGQCQKDVILADGAAHVRWKDVVLVHLALGPVSQDVILINGAQIELQCKCYTRDWILGLFMGM